MEIASYVYFLTNARKTVLYVGVTSDLIRRVYEQKHHFVKGFTQKYHVDRLVYYEVADNIMSAIAREKQIKGWLRYKKNVLVDAFNPEWQDLYDSIC